MRVRRDEKGAEEEERRERTGRDRKGHGDRGGGGDTGDHNGGEKKRDTLTHPQVLLAASPQLFLLILSLLAEGLPRGSDERAPPTAVGSIQQQACFMQLSSEIEDYGLMGWLTTGLCPLSLGPTQRR